MTAAAALTGTDFRNGLGPGAFMGPQGCPQVAPRRYEFVDGADRTTIVGDDGAGLPDQFRWQLLCWPLFWQNRLSSFRKALCTSLTRRSFICFIMLELRVRHCRTR